MVKIKDTHIPPGYKKSEVGVIPEEWEVKKIGEKAIFLKTASLPRKQLLTEGTICYVHYGDIHTSDNVFLDLHKTTLPFAPSIYVGTVDRLQEGDLVFVDASEDREGVGKSVEIKNANKIEAIAGLHTIAVRLSRDVFDHGFKAYLQFIPQFKSHLRKLAAGTKVYATQKHHIGSALIPLPPLSEQRAIARVLSDVDGLIEKKRALKTAAMQQLLTGRVRLPGFAGEWVTRRLGELANLYQPVTISAREFKEYGYPVYGANGIVGYYDKTNHEAWQVTVTCRGSTCGTVNRTVDKCWITGNAMVLNVDHNSEIYKEFFYYLIKIQDLSSCITGTGQPQIVRGALAAFQVRLPKEKNEQRAIAAVLSDMDAEIAALEARREKVRQVKQGMMQVLLTGRVRLVGEAAKEMQNT